MKNGALWQPNLKNAHKQKMPNMLANLKELLDLQSKTELCGVWSSVKNKHFYVQTICLQAFRASCPHWIPTSSQQKEITPAAVHPPWHVDVLKPPCFVTYMAEAGISALVKKHRTLTRSASKSWKPKLARENTFQNHNTHAYTIRIEHSCW